MVKKIIKIIREPLGRCLLLFQCLKTFPKDWLLFYRDAIEYRNGMKGLSEIHCIKYKGQSLYYRTRTTDIILIICILVKNNMYKFDLCEREVEWVLDLGANIGLFSLKYAIHYPNIKFVAVEPEDENYKIMEMNLGQLSNVIILKAGVWWREANLTIKNSDAESWAFQVVESENGEYKGLSIDLICGKYNATASVIKMDIEGSEMVVFQHINDSKWINEVKLLVCETHDHIFPGSYKLVTEAMKARGYSLSQMGESLIFEKQT